jgi:hypothetical protein
MSEETRSEGAEQRVNDEAPRSVSERKRQANRENSRKSTGPKTARGKRNSSFNAVKHGLLVQRISIETDEDTERLNQFATGLYNRYEIEGDLRNELLLEFALVDYCRHARGLGAENSQFSNMFSAYSGNPQASANLIRYMTSNRRALIRTLDMLEEARDKRIHEEQSADLAADGPRAPSRGARRGDPNKKPPRRHSSGDRENPPKPQASTAAQMAQGKKAA